MKIGIFDPYLDDLGGGEKYMMSMATCLSSRHEVSVFWDEAHDIQKLVERFSFDFSNITIAPNIFSPRLNKIQRLLETRKYDLIIFLSDGSIPFTLSKKLFLHIQQPLHHIEKTSVKFQMKQRRITGIFCNSEFTKNYNKRFFSIPMSVIYPPVVLMPKKIKKENIILHVGRFRIKNVTGIDDFKKQGVMLSEFKNMVDQGLIRWKFVVATSIQDEDQDAFEKVKESVEGYPVEFMINVPNEKLWDIYSKAKIYWHASGYGEDLEKHPEFAEHFGISTVEAMGAGAVPVVINAGGQKEIVADGENGFLWNTLDELQEKTFMLTNDETLLKNLSGAAKKRAEFFAGDRFCREIRRLIKQ